MMAVQQNEAPVLFNLHLCLLVMDKHGFGRFGFILTATARHMERRWI